MEERAPQSIDVSPSDRKDVSRGATMHIGDLSLIQGVLAPLEAVQHLPRIDHDE